MRIVPVEDNGREGGRRNAHRGSFDRPHFFVPTNFDAAAVLPTSLGRYADCANYFVGCVVMGMALRRADAAGFVRLKVAYLRKVIPVRVERVIRKALVGAGVLVQDSCYVIGEMAMGYCLTDNFRAGCRRVECQDRKVAARIERLRGARYRTDAELPVHRHLKGWLDRLDIDADAAHDTIVSTPGLANHADIHMTAVNMIDSGHVEFSHCDKGRVHSLPTRLPKELRQHLRIDNQPIINIDITNSQPLILFTLTHPTTPPTQHATTNTLCILSQPHIYTVDAAGFPEDQKRYISLCEKGVIYDYLRDAAGLTLLTRSQVKLKFYTEIFFGRNQVVTDFSRLFEREFPTVMRVIRERKRKDYTALACAMQRAESRIIIHDACRHLMIHHPDIPIVTIHDSIMTTPPHVEIVRQAMLGAFANVGLRPTLKVDWPEQELAMAA
jgi:hypothetical protein